MTFYPVTARLGHRHGDGNAARCVPSSCIAALPGTIWRPLAKPASDYPWSVLWRAVVSSAQAMSKRLNWLTTANQTEGL